MDDITDDDLRRALRGAGEEAASADRPSVVSVATALRSRVAGPDDPLGALAAALEYYPVDPAECGGHGTLAAGVEPRCGCYGALGSDAASAFPLWARSLEYAPRPLVAARFADLLWTARYGDTSDVWAQRAVDAYLASASDTFGHVLEISEGLQRAFAISAQIGDGPRHGEVIAALIGLVTQTIESEERSSGVSLSILEFLADPSSPDRPAELEGLLDRALDRYRDDPWLLEWALDIKAGLVEPERREELHRAQVDAFVDLARRSDGLLRYAHYQHAIELAARHEIPVVDALRREIDAPFPPDPVAEFVARIVGDDSLADALARFGACLPTEATDPESHEAELERLSFFGILAVELLARLRGRYGAVSAAGSWFECALIDRTVARDIAQSIERYEGGELDAAVTVLAPGVEGIIRLVAAAADPTVTDPATARLDSGDGNRITDVLAALAGALYEPSRRYLQVLMADSDEPLAPLREANGTPDAVTKEHVALLVHAACHLRLLQPVESAAKVAPDR
jgi:hypothetical protein